MSSSDIGLAGAMYVAGACLGALFFGQLTDRFGRKKLFLITLGVYTVATVLTAFSMNPTWYFAARVPHRRRHRRRVRRDQLRDRRADPGQVPRPGRHRDQRLVLGRRRRRRAADDPAARPDHRRAPPSGWRLAFGLGAILAVGILLVRRNVPESPRWLFIHGREDEGEEIVRDIERDRRTRRPGSELPRSKETITIRQRKTIGIAADRQDRLHAVPEADRALLLAVRRPGVPLQRVLLHLRRHPDDVPRRRARPATTSPSSRSATSLGALLLSPLFDSVGRVRMIAGTYILSGVLLGDRRLHARRPDAP